MKKSVLISVAGLSLSAMASGYDPSFSADGRKWQQVPTGHVPGRDNGAGTGTHNAGEDCGICHTPGGKAEKYLFSMSGTVYADRAARQPAKGAEVIIQDGEGKVISMTANEVGNFWTFTPIASNPKGIASHGGKTERLFSYDAEGNLIPANPEDSRTWLYKGWVKNGDIVRPMVSIVPVGGATGTAPRMSCNMHHAPMGSSGALWSSREHTLPSYPDSRLSFRKHILPIFGSKCAPCHIPGLRATRLVTESDIAPTGATSIDYSGGHDFTSYEGSSMSVTVNGQVQTLVKRGIRDAVDTASPDLSRVLVKTRLQPPGSAVQHAGGSFWAPGDPDYEAIRKWIEEGAQDN